MSDLKFDKFFSKLMGDVKTATEDEKRSYLENAKKELQAAHRDPLIDDGMKMKAVIDRLCNGYPGDKKDFEKEVERPFKKQVLEEQIKIAEFKIQSLQCDLDMMNSRLNMLKMMKEMFDKFSGGE